MNLLKMIRIVMWSFFGVRRGAAHQSDMTGIKLPLLPVIAVILAGAFGFFLLSLARFAAAVAH